MDGDILVVLMLLLNEKKNQPHSIHDEEKSYEKANV